MSAKYEQRIRTFLTLCAKTFSENLEKSLRREQNFIHQTHDRLDVSGQDESFSGHTFAVFLGGRNPAEEGSRVQCVGSRKRLERSKGGHLKERGARRMGHSGEELRGTDPSKICWEWKVVVGVVVKGMMRAYGRDNFGTPVSIRLRLSVREGSST